MDHIQLLDKTKTAFINHQNAGNRYHYPDGLKNAAISLLKYYSAQELSRQLNISVKSLKNWCKGSRTTAMESTAFVPLILNDEIIKFNSPLSESLLLKLPHQLELILPTKSIKDTAQFICCLIKEISTCSI